MPVKTLKNIASAVVSLTLVVGLCPTPALADSGLTSADPTGASLTTETVDTNTPRVVSDPTQIESEHYPYGDDIDESWSYTYDEAVDGFAIQFDEYSCTESNYDFVTVTDSMGEEVAKISGDLANTNVYVPSGNSFTLTFTSDVNNCNYYGIKIATVRPLNDRDRLILNLDDEAKQSFFTDSNITINNAPASEYDSKSYPLNPDDQQLPVVKISNKSATLTLDEGSEFELDYTKNGETAEPTKAGSYSFSIRGKGPFASYCAGDYQFSIVADAAGVKSAIDSLELPDLATIDNVYPDADGKASVLKSFTSDIQDIEFSLGYIDNRDEAVGTKALAKLERAQNLASQLVDVSSMTIWIDDTDGTQTFDSVRYIADGNPVKCNPVLKSEYWDEESNQSAFENVNKSCYDVSYRNTIAGTMLDGVPSDIGRYDIVVKGLGAYYGSLEKMFTVTNSPVFAYINGDTLVFTPNKPAGAFYENPEILESNEEMWDGVPKWYTERDRIKRVFVEPETTLFDTRYLFMDCSSLAEVDFTNLNATYVMPDDNYGTFFNCPALSKITFGPAYKPYYGSGLTGTWVNPDNPKEIWETDDLYDKLTTRIAGTWVRNAETDPWTLQKRMVSIPSVASIIYDGNEHTALKNASDYTVTGNVKATHAGSYSAIATLIDPATTQWADGTTTPKTIEWSIAKKTIAVPTAKAGLVYNGAAQTGVAAGEGYTVTKDGTATDAGTHTATVEADKNHQFTGNKTTVSVPWTIAKATIAAPTAKANLVYTGAMQTGVAAGTGYELSGTTTAANAGTYKATATPTKNYQFAAGKDTATITWRIDKADISKATVALTKASAAYTGKKQTSGVKSVTLGSKALTIADYTAVAASGKEAGSYTATVTGQGNYTGTAKATFKITQAKNTATAKKTSVKKTLKAKNLKKKAATVALPKVTAKFGTAKWKVSAKDKKKVLTLKNGKIQVKKGAKKGTYTIKLKASVAKTKNYKAATTKAVTVKVTVK